MTNIASKIIKAELRERPSKGRTRRLRKTGWVPGVIYGGGRTLSVAVDAKTLPAGHSGCELVALDVTGTGSVQALMREVQVDPLTQNLVHMDFQEVTPETVVTVNLPVRTVGITREQEKVGYMKTMARSIVVRGMVKDLPAVLEVDIAHLSTDQTLHARDLTIPANVQLRSRPNKAMAQLVAN